MNRHNFFTNIATANICSSIPFDQQVAFVPASRKRNMATSADWKNSEGRIWWMFFQLSYPSLSGRLIIAALRVIKFIPSFLFVLSQYFFHFTSSRNCCAFSIQMAAGEFLYCISHLYGDIIDEKRIPILFNLEFLINIRRITLKLKILTKHSPIDSH